MCICVTLIWNSLSKALNQTKLISAKFSFKFYYWSWCREWRVSVSVSNDAYHSGEPEPSLIPANTITATLSNSSISAPPLYSRIEMFLQRTGWCWCGNGWWWQVNDSNQQENWGLIIHNQNKYIYIQTLQKFCPSEPHNIELQSFDSCVL